MNRYTHNTGREIKDPRGEYVGAAETYTSAKQLTIELNRLVGDVNGYQMENIRLRAELAGLREDEKALDEKLADMNNEFDGYSWDGGAGSSGFNEAIQRVVDFIAERKAVS